MRIAAARVAVLIAATLAAAPPTLAAQPDVTEGEAAFAATCQHYVNRARFKPRSGRVEPVTVLAEACPAALRSLQEPGREASAAQAFLARLTAGHAVITGMNSDRFAQNIRGPGGASVKVQDFARSVGLVSATGEYLILRAEGVFDALDAWAAHRRDFQLHTALRCGAVWPRPALRASRGGDRRGSANCCCTSP